MALTRDPKAHILIRSSLDVVAFTMLDEHGTRVSCRVSLEALRDKAAKHGLRGQFELDTFHRFRTEIEKIASDNYAAGHPQPLVVTTEQLMSR